MSNEEMRIAVAERCGRKWYWRVSGSDEINQCFTWELHLAIPPEGGIGTHWKGCAGETREATPDEIANAKRTKEFVCYEPNYPDSAAIRAARQLFSGDNYHSTSFLDLSQVAAIISVAYQPQREAMRLAKEALVELEWSATRNFCKPNNKTVILPSCPFCDSLERNGHYKSCELHQALSAIKAVTDYTIIPSPILEK